MRYESTGSEARFLIEHMLDEPGSSISTPTGFLSRASWNDLFAAGITESPEGVVSTDSYCSGEDDRGEDGDDDEKEERSLSHQLGALTLSRNKGFGATNTTGKRHVALDEEEAALSSSLDFMDKEEELEAALHMAMKTAFHRMFGPSQDEASNFPPSQIDC